MWHHMTTSVKGHANLWISAPISLVTIDIVVVEMFLIYHVTSYKHMYKRLCELMGGSPSWWVTTLPHLRGNWSSASEDMKYLIRHVISQNHLIQGSGNIMSGSYVTTLPRLMAIGIVVVKMLLSHDQAIPRD